MGDKPPILDYKSPETPLPKEKPFILQEALSTLAIVLTVAAIALFLIAFFNAIDGYYGLSPSLGIAAGMFLGGLGCGGTGYFAWKSGLSNQRQTAGGEPAFREHQATENPDAKGMSVGRLWFRMVVAVIVGLIVLWTFLGFL